MSEDKTKIYHLTADYKKSTYQTEQWNNTLSNGKHVRFEVTMYFYWGTFEIELTDSSTVIIFFNTDCMCLAKRLINESLKCLV